MIQVYVLITFWDENGIHKAGTFTEVKEENFDPFYMQKVDSGSVDAYTKAETDALLDAKQDDLTAGTNISINDDVISATDTGDTVQITRSLTSGTQIANIKVNGTDNKLFAPAGGSSITTFALQDGYGQAISVSQFTGGSITDARLKNAADGTFATFENILAAFAAGEIVINVGSQWDVEKLHLKVDAISEGQAFKFCGTYYTSTAKTFVFEYADSSKWKISS